jgi:hypothetical protein
LMLFDVWIALCVVILDNKIHYSVWVPGALATYLYIAARAHKVLPITMTFP